MLSGPWPLDYTPWPPPPPLPPLLFSHRSRLRVQGVLPAPLEESSRRGLGVTGQQVKALNLEPALTSKPAYSLFPPAGLLWDHIQGHDSGPLPTQWSFGVGGGLGGLVGHTVYSYPFYFEGSPACVTPALVSQCTSCSRYRAFLSEKPLVFHL